MNFHHLVAILACTTMLGLNARAQTLAQTTAPTLLDLPPVGDTCLTVTDKAMAADLGAATAQSKKLELAEQLRWNEESIAMWMKAITQCEGRGKERAQRNLTDSQKVRVNLQEQMAGGPQCEAAHKNATHLQDLGKQALTERRFDEAAVLYRKSEDTWELATERCTGTQQLLAAKRREQTGIDSHNAEHCAPLFEKAREHTQKFRGSSANLSREEKQQGSLVVETLWRDAMVHCKDAVLEAVRSNAQLVARERGTPWVATRTEAALPGPVKAAGKAAELVPGIANGAVAAAGSPAIGKAAGSAAAAGAVTGAVTGAPIAAGVTTVTPPQAVPQPAEFTAGTTRFSGRFVQDVGGATYTGVGKLVWANGDSFEGSLVQGQRQGRGLFIWANGQRYHGDWVRDQPNGRADIQFVNGNIYEGEVQQGVPSGNGKMRYASGDHYMGQFLTGAPDGRGTYVWANGQRFEGPWRAGRSQGDGQLSFANGDVYTGPVVNGMPQGQGRFQFGSGDSYDGQLAQGQPDGQGSYTWANGDRYVGAWKAGKKHGQGVFNWKSGERWEGMYENDLQAVQAPPSAQTAQTAQKVGATPEK